ncbi:MAG: hypothetical protein OXF22_00240 [Anaerolineaceae bacterium]|nr:hypothetical protein [Anaerolineaceae bacterium]
MRCQLFVALLILLYSLLAVGNYGLAQNRQDYIITHEPSVNVRPCPRFTEECNAIYRLPAGTIIRDGVAVQGDRYASSDEWIRFIRNGELAYIHSSLVRLAPPNSDLADVERAHAWVALYNDYSGYSGNAEASVQIFWRVGARKLHVYVGGAECYNRVRIFENEITELECSIFSEVWILRNITRIHLIIEGENYDDPETELRCGRHNDSTDTQLLFACVLEDFQPTSTPTVRPTRTPIPTRRPTSTPRPTRTTQSTSFIQCDHITFPINGTIDSRRNIFERWLDCQHDLTRRTFENLYDEERMFDIWWEFVEYACGYASYPKYWIIDTDWRCKQLTSDRDALNEPPCGPVHLTGSRFTREREFSRWLECEYGIDSNQFYDLHSIFAIPIGWSFITTACGEQSATYYWQINENWFCERRSSRTGEILPTYIPTEAPTRTPRPTRTPSPTRTPMPTRTPYPTPTSACGPEELTGSVINRVAIFEHWLKCEHNLELEVFWDLPDSRWGNIWWAFVKLSCGEDSNSSYWNIDYDSWECEQIPRGEITQCEPDDLTGTIINRILIFEQWLNCEHDIDYMIFLNTLNEFRQSEILREFAWLVCSSETDDDSWYIDENWECQKEVQDDGYSA